MDRPVSLANPTLTWRIFLYCPSLFRHPRPRHASGSLGDREGYTYLYSQHNSSFLELQLAPCRVAVARARTLLVPMGGARTRPSRKVVFDLKVKDRQRTLNHHTQVT